MSFGTATEMLQVQFLLKQQPWQVVDTPVSLSPISISLYMCKNREGNVASYQKGVVYHP